MVMNIKNLMLGIAILIMTIFVGVYGINLLYNDPPKYEQFCPQQPITSEAQCSELGGIWTNYTTDGQPLPAEAKTPAVTPTGYCDVYTKCSNEFQQANEKYFKNLFIVALIVGLVIIAVGLLVFALAPVGVGLMAGGIAIFIWGSARYWTYANNLTKFIISLVGLVVLILMAYYFNNKFKNKKLKF